GLIDTAELVRVMSTVNVHRERPRTPLNTPPMDTSTSTDEHRERPGQVSSERPAWTSSERQFTSTPGESERQLTSTVQDLVDTLREQMQLMRDELQAAREERALLLQMLQDMQQRYDRLLDMPRSTPQDATEATQTPRRAHSPPDPRDRPRRRERPR